MFKVATLLQNTVITGLTCRTCAIMFKIYLIFCDCVCVCISILCVQLGAILTKLFIIVGLRLFTVSLMVTLLALPFLVKYVGLLDVCAYGFVCMLSQFEHTFAGWVTSGAILRAAILVCLLL